MDVALVTRTPAKEDQGDALLATEETPDSGNKMERFSYKGELANE